MSMRVITVWPGQRGPGVGLAEAAWSALAESLGPGASSGAGHGGAGRGLSQLAWAIQLARGLRQLVPASLQLGGPALQLRRAGGGGAGVALERRDAAFQRAASLEPAPSWG